MAEGFRLTENDLPALAIGAGILGTGGGGDPYLGMLRCRQLLRDGARLDVLPLDALPDDALIGEVGGIGAPVVSIEKLRQGGEGLRAIRAVEAAIGGRIAATISAEIGGSNAMEPLIAAAQAGLPVIDGDGMGRAFPEVQMSTFLIYGAAPAPAAIADDKGNAVVFSDVVDMYWLEHLARGVAVNMGASALLATAPMRMDFVRRAAVPGTVTQALNIGRAVLDARHQRRDVLEALAYVAGAQTVFRGKITDVRRELKGGFARGHALIEGHGAYAGQAARIAIQNENLVLWIDGEARITVPDLIMNLEEDTGQPISTETLRFGQRVATVALPAHALLKTPEALAVVGPAAFGYPELTYQPL